MKTTLLLLVFIAFSMQAQTTHNLDWKLGSLSPVTDLTINIGDTVKWTWTDAFPHTVENSVGSTETFNSGTKTGIGETFSYTFTLAGSNPYFCGIHGALNMSGTITVENPLGIEDFALSDFSILPNPVSTRLFLKLPDGIDIKTISIFDLLGNQIYSSNNAESSINISNLATGMYLLRVSSQNINHTKRFVKF